jgi:hypothetical protein
MGVRPSGTLEQLQQHREARAAVGLPTPYLWQRPAIPGGSHPCACCGVIADKFPPDGVIAVGFGAASLTCNGAEVYDEQRVEEGQYMTGAEAEAMAAKHDPDNDWRINLYGPLWGGTYQRHAPGEWVLIERNEGFA